MHFFLTFPEVTIIYKIIYIFLIYEIVLYYVFSSIICTYRLIFSRDISFQFYIDIH